VNEDVIAYAILFGWCGFSWGRWWADRQRKRSDDPALTMLCDMLDSILEKRKMVGRAMTISSTHRFEIMGERLSIVVEAEGVQGEAHARG
jgi:hypothetical protein